MTDPILAARLDALKQNLERVESGRSWWESLQPWWDSVQLRLPGAVREGLNAAVMDQARRHLKALKRIREKLEEAEQADDAIARDLLKEAWRHYAEVYEQCQKFFGECLEVIGGLALRGSGLEEERLYQVADELMTTCTVESTRMFASLSPTVPALPETLIKTMARIIGLRFPEWTIWTLPFTAHELGHVVMCEDKELQGFVVRQVEAWTNGSTKKRAENHLQEFLADAFATYTMGPAYACAVILLRFNPSAAHLDDDEHPGDAKRAYVVRTMLRKMNDQAGLDSPYDDVLERLTSAWQATLASAGQPHELGAPDAQRLDKLIDAVWMEFDEWLRDTAIYPHSEKDYGWVIAEKWSRTWHRQLEEGQRLDIQEVSKNNKLRDVLNAAWLCRLDYVNKLEEESEKIEQIAEAAHRLCEEIRKKRAAPSPGRGAARGQPIQPSRGPRLGG